MATVSTYLNFPGTTEAAFAFYRSVFQSEYQGTVVRMGDLPSMDGQAPMPAAMKDKIMHICLPIAGGHLLMGTDAVEGMGPSLNLGNHAHIVLNCGSREEADALFSALSEGGDVGTPMTDMMWGSYWGSFKDRFGMNWMVDHAPKKA